MLSETKGSVVEFKDLSYQVTFEDKESKMCKKKMQTKQIIRGVSGAVNPGQCLAIMGPSGAGKTTLLNLLAGRIQGQGVTGDIRFDGKVLTAIEIASIVGFVMQNDIFIEFMTIEETLMFAANLKLKGKYEDKMARVNKLIGDLKLEDCRNTLVGGQFIKGISGGEKKRLNIAFELISDPPIIYLDEPTSGLDSYTSFIVVKLMNTIAKEVGKTIIYTIHQPSSDIFRMFDQLLLIYRGKLIYQGNANQAVDYFDKQLYLPCPFDSNPSDHFMYTMQSTSPKIEAHLIDTYDRLLAQNYTKLIEPKKDVQFQIKQFAPKLLQLKATLGRGLLITRRNPMLTLVKISQMIVLGFFYCSIYFQLSSDPSDTVATFNKNGALFFLTTFHFIPSMMSFIVTFPLQRAVFLKEYSGRFYEVLPYYLSKILVEIPFALVFPIIFTCIIYYIVGFNPEFVRLVKQNVVAVILVFCSQMLGVLIGCSFDSIDVALNITPLIFMPLMLFGGFFVNSDSIPKWMTWLEYASPFRYSLEALVRNEFEDTNYLPNPIDSFGYSLDYTTVVLILLGMGIVLGIFGYIALRLRARNLNN
jgi:ABC-type multidrug transport system ATPase subunit